MTVAALTELFLMNMGYARADAAEPDVVAEYAGTLMRWLNEGYTRAVLRTLGREAVKCLDPLRAEEDGVPEEDAAYCPQCGAPVEADALFCPACGGSL